MPGIIDGRLFGYVQCDIEVPEHLHDYFSNFPPLLKNTVVSRDDIGTLMREYAEKEYIMVQPKIMLISSFFSNKWNHYNSFASVLFKTWPRL